MNLTNKEEKELCEWGMQFYEMGFLAAVELMQDSIKIGKPIKTKAVKDYLILKLNENKKKD